MMASRSIWRYVRAPLTSSSWGPPMPARDRAAQPWAGAMLRVASPATRRAGARAAGRGPHLPACLLRSTAAAAAARWTPAPPAPLPAAVCAGSWPPCAEWPRPGTCGEQRRRPMSSWGGALWWLTREGWATPPPQLMDTSHAGSRSEVHAGAHAEPLAASVQHVRRHATLTAVTSGPMRRACPHLNRSTSVMQASWNCSTASAVEIWSLMSSSVMCANASSREAGPRSPPVLAVASSPPALPKGG